MSELRLYAHRDSLRDNIDCLWTVRHEDGHIMASGSSLENLPQTQHCHLVLPADLVTVLPLRLPDLAPSKLAPLLSAAVEAHVLGQAEHLHVASLGRDEQGLSWLAVVDKGWLQYTLARLAEKGIFVDAALPESLLLPLEDNAWSLLRHEDGALLRVSPSFGLALDHGDPPAGLLMALNHVDAIGSGRPQRLCLYQGSAMDFVDLERWQSACSLSVEMRGSWDWRVPSWPGTNNLLQGLFLPRHGRVNPWLILRLIVLGGLLLAVVQMVGMTVDRMLLSVEQRTLQTQMRTLAERVLPAHAAVVDPAWQIGAQLKALHAANGDDNEGMVALLSIAGKLRPSEGNFELKEIGFEGGRLSLVFAQADEEWLRKFVSALTTSGFSASLAPSKVGGATLVVGAASLSSVKRNSHGR